MTPAARAARWVRAHAPDLLLAALVAIALLPVVAFRFFPSTDGPEHLDVAAVMAQRGALARKLAVVFRVKHGVSPYATVYTILAPLAKATSPETAEKILLVLYFVAAPLAFRFAAGALHARGRRLASLVVPLLATFPLYMGFYNYVLGVVVWLVLVGLWLRCRGRFTRSLAFAFALALAAAFFTHTTAIVAALAFIGPAHAVVIVSAMRRADRWSAIAPAIVLPAAACIPALLLALRFGSQFRPAWALSWKPVTRTLLDLVTLDALVALAPEERVVAGALALVLFGALAYVVRTGVRAPAGEGSVWAGLGGVVGLAIAGPDRWTTDAFVMGPRFAIAATMTIALVVAARIEAPRLRAALAVAAAIATLAFVGVRWRWHARFDAQVAEIETVMREAQPGEVLVPVLYAKRGRNDSLSTESALRTLPLLHAPSRFAGSRGVVSLHNHLACTSFAPVTFAAPDMNAMIWLQQELEAWDRPAPTFDLAEAESRVRIHFDLVLVWGEPSADPDVAEPIATRNERLAEGWVLVARAGSAALYRHFPGMRRPPVP